MFIILLFSEMAPLSSTVISVSVQLWWVYSVPKRKMPIMGHKAQLLAYFLAISTHKLLSPVMSRRVITRCVSVCEYLKYILAWVDTGRELDRIQLCKINIRIVLLFRSSSTSTCTQESESSSLDFHRQYRSISDVDECEIAIRI